MTQKILVTGASGGIGRLVTATLLARGHTVVASVRGLNDKNKSAAEALRNAGAKIVEIDVTCEESVNRGVADAVQAAGHLDGVVNNAGVGVIGLQECFTPEDWQHVFDVNLFGVQRVNRAVLPHLRNRRAGLLIHVTSLLGRYTIPFHGPYCASKWALEALAENYRVELSGQGIEVCIVEPGGFASGFHDHLLKPGDLAREIGYGDLASAPAKALAEFQNTLRDHPEQEPQNVAEAIATLVDTPAGRRPFRTVVDDMGLRDIILRYNEELAEVTREVYAMLGMEAMLTLKVR